MYPIMKNTSHSNAHKITFWPTCIASITKCAKSCHMSRKDGITRVVFEGNEFQFGPGVGETVVSWCLLRKDGPWNAVLVRVCTE
eukprot:CCRYP_019981-RA/>CCRYP_019981-RA protein AED:0.23 eAED:0.23 QI:226/1/1/1/0/0/2/81/83